MGAIPRHELDLFHGACGSTLIRIKEQKECAGRGEKILQISTEDFEIPSDRCVLCIFFLLLSVDTLYLLIS